MPDIRTLDEPHREVYVVIELAQAKQRPQLTLIRSIGVFTDSNAALRCQKEHPRSTIIEGYEAFSDVKILATPMLG
jgi:hypothetical protein